MRIVSIDIPPTPTVNLGPIKMDKLGGAVVVAGRNGAGKTRLMKRLIEWQQAARSVPDPEPQVAAYRQRLAQATVGSPQYAQFEKQVNELESRLLLRRGVTLSEKGSAVIVPFVPNKLELSDPNAMSKANLLKASKSVETPGIGHLPSGSFARIQALQDRRWEATHPSRTGSKEEIAETISEYERLEELIKRFLNTAISRSLNGEAQLFGLPLGKTALSDGQKVVLQLCIAIHAQGANLNNLIIFMDEPENHLHPAALLDLVTAVQERVGDGQLWIATHSIPLLAEVDPSAIWWMESDTISKAGDRPERVLEGLLGDEGRRDRLASFLDLPFALASNRFAAECLVPPPTVSHRSNDPQTRQIREVLEGLAASDMPVRMLDFGAGKGRLASEFAEVWTEEQQRRIDYIAYDPGKKDVEECLAAVSRLYDSAEGRHFEDLTALRGRYDEGSFHFVVMCNVLHEILPSEWGGLFGPEGKVTRLLRDDGFLLLVEVQQLPYGERAHQHGFLVLDTAQLRKLFAITEADSDMFLINEQRDGWLKAHLIGQPILKRFTAISREAALKDLSSTARDRIRQLRDQGTDYRHGRLHGFWVQQFANAQLALG